MISILRCTAAAMLLAFSVHSAAARAPLPSTCAGAHGAIPPDFIEGMRKVVGMDAAYEYYLAHGDPDKAGKVAQSELAYLGLLAAQYCTNVRPQQLIPVILEVPDGQGYWELLLDSARYARDQPPPPPPPAQSGGDGPGILFVVPLN